MSFTGEKTLKDASKNLFKKNSWVAVAVALRGFAWAIFALYLHHLTGLHVPAKEQRNHR